MNEAMDSPPFSQCDAKGRCLRHPTVQMSRKKKLGGWKKLLGICPLCAMELMAEDRRAAPSSSEASRERGEPSDAASVHSARSSRSSGAGRRQRRAPRVGHHYDGHDDHDDDDHRSVGTHGNRSVDRSVLSAPAVPYGPGSRDDPRVGRSGSRRSPPSSKSKRGSLVFSSDSSCDTTVDLSYSSEYSSSGSSSRRGGGRSSGSFHSQGSCTPPLHEEGPPAPLPARHPRHDHVDDEGEFVCGMELYVDDRTRCFYTGQIHAGTQLPHGLGTLRSDVDGSILEGSWEHGRLVQENGEASPSPSPPPPHEYGGRPDFASPADGHEAYPLDHQGGGYQEEYQRGYVQEYPEECQEGEYDYCHPCAPSQDQDEDQHPEDYQDGYQDDYEGSLSGDFQRCRVDDYDSSFGHSVAETLQGGSSSFASSFGSSDDASSTTGSATSGYSARERKSSLPPPGGERERVRRVRFREDP